MWNAWPENQSIWSARISAQHQGRVSVCPGTGAQTRQPEQNQGMTGNKAGVSWSGFQLSVESNCTFALVLLCYALWLVDITRASFSTNKNPNENQPCLARTRFPALSTGCMYLLWILIGSLCCFRLWLARVITLFLVLRRSTENRSNDVNRSIKGTVSWEISRFLAKIH